MLPLKQGELDYLCGVYVVMNTVNYLYGPLTDSKLSSLFEGCLQALAAKQCLIQRMCRKGTLSHEIAALLELVGQHYPLSHQRPFYAQSSMALPEFWQRCQQFLTAPHTVILLRIGGHSEHWTLATHMTDQVITLWDSTKLPELMLNQCHIAGQKPITQPYTFYPAQIRFIRRP